MSNNICYTILSPNRDYELQVVYGQRAVTLAEPVKWANGLGVGLIANDLSKSEPPVSIGLSRDMVRALHGALGNILFFMDNQEVKVEELGLDNKIDLSGLSRSELETMIKMGLKVCRDKAKIKR